MRPRQVKTSDYLQMKHKQDKRGINKTSMSLDSAFSLALRSSASLRRHSFSSICRVQVERSHKYTVCWKYCLDLSSLGWVKILNVGVVSQTWIRSYWCPGILSWRLGEGDLCSTSTTTTLSSSSESDATSTFTVAPS